MKLHALMNNPDPSQGWYSDRVGFMVMKLKLYDCGKPLWAVLLKWLQENGSKPP